MILRYTKYAYYTKHRDMILTIHNDKLNMVNVKNFFY